MSRDKILEKIANLRALADDAGSSEGEAMNAAALAAKLMAAYDVSEAELHTAETEGRIVIEERVIRGGIKNSYRGHAHRVAFVCVNLGKFTDTRPVITNGGCDIAFVGERVDVELAEFLFGVIKDALDREYEAYRKRTVGVGRGAKASFQYGMVNRIAQRLYEMTAEKNAEIRRIASEKSNTGTDLVVTDYIERKREAVEAEFTQRYPHLGTSYRRVSANNGNAYSSGYAAGDRVSLGRPVGKSNVKMIA